MKLLLDQNLSRRLVSALDGPFPGSSHVALLGLERSGDREIWERARSDGFTLVSKDADFVELARRFGEPPAVVHLDLGNCTTAEIARVLLKNAAAIQALEGEAEAILVLTRDEVSGRG